MKTTALRAVLALLLAVALGVLGGWLWWHWWGPATEGQIYDVGNGPHWYDVSANGLKHAFSATAEYVLIGVVLGLVLGVVVGLLARGREILFLAVVVVGAAGAAYLTWQVGTLLGPDAPPVTAANVCHAQPCKDYLGSISVSGWSPYLVWPVGALAGYLVVMLSMHSMSTVPSLSSETTESEQPRSPAAS